MADKLKLSGTGVTLLPDSKWTMASSKTMLKSDGYEVAIGDGKVVIRVAKLGKRWGVWKAEAKVALWLVPTYYAWAISNKTRTEPDLISRLCAGADSQKIQLFEYQCATTNQKKIEFEWDISRVKKPAGDVRILVFSMVLNREVIQLREFRGQNSETTPILSGF